MRTGKCRTAMCLALVGVALTLPRARADELPPPGEVELLILSPQGEPVLKRDVTVRPFERHLSFGPFPITLQSDAQGKVVFPWPEGEQKLRVFVPGVGYGLTGTMYVERDRRTRAFLPPLAPYATIRGTIPEEYRTAEWQVNLTKINYEEIIPLQVKDDGSFECSAPGGLWMIRIEREKERIANAREAVIVLPGETAMLTSPIKKVPPRDKPAVTAKSSTPDPQEPKREAWATGTVRDTAGKPIPHVDVYCAVEANMGMRSHELVAAAKTDENGMYQVMGESLSVWSNTALVVAHAAGYCSAWNWKLGPKFVDGKVVEASPPVDFVLGKEGGTLEVQLFEEGQPAQGQWVGLLLQGPDLGTLGMPTRSDARTAFEQLKMPRAQTNWQGIARFEQLIPGRYDIIAGQSEQLLHHHNHFGRVLLRRYAFGENTDIPVPMGTVTRHRMELTPPSVPDISLRVLGVEGEPLENRKIECAFGTLWNSQRSTTWLDVNDEGIIKRRFGSLGLWSLTFQFHNGNPKHSSVHAPPYWQASGIVACSPLLGILPLASFAALPVEPASVTVELLDERGQPLSGTVELSSTAYDPALIGSTDTKGKVRFEGVRGGPARGNVISYLPVKFGEEGEPLPEDEQLRAHRAMLPPMPVSGEPNSDTHVKIQAYGVGYVRGRVIPRSGKTAADYDVNLTHGQFLSHGDYSVGVGIQYQSDTGEFVAGPFRKGKVELRLIDRAAKAQIDMIEFEVQPGVVPHRKVVAPELADEKKSSLSAGKSTSSGYLFQRPLSKVTVKMADGKTPAVGAVAYLLYEKYAEPWTTGLADAMGAIRAPERNWTRAYEPPPIAGGPKGNLVVTLVPGTCGAVFVEYLRDQPQELTLPAAQQVRGRVTVGGESPTGKRGQIRVVAAYQGQGRLNEFLSVETTADVDGRFVLAGLTPGEYVVQAALDGIWLSDSISLRAGDKPLGDLKLDIGTPGGAASILLTDAAGEPLREAVLTLDRPQGPLAELCWPAEWTSDGQGRVYIPALEAGEHTFHVKVDGSEHHLTVPALPAAEITQVEVRVEK